jgi:streptomycin 6-kinase
MMLTTEQASRVVNAFGEAGAQWLTRLPALLSTCADRWGLQLRETLPGSTHNLVVAATSADGSDYVLKLGVPHPELHAEIAALREFGGHGAVRLHAADPDQGALLLEQVRPGCPLDARHENDQAAALAVAQVLRRLWRPPQGTHPFPTAADWGRGFERMRARGGGSPLPGALAGRAECRYRSLVATQSEPVLLHGDLHYENILACGQNGWVAIDPKGVLGEPAYDLGAFLRNAANRPGAAGSRPALTRLIDLLAEELRLPRSRVRDWAFAQAVLSAGWCLEDGWGGWEGAIIAAESLETA